MNDKIKTILNLSVFLVLFLMRCILAEGGDAAVISKKAVVGKGCLSNEREFVFSG